MITLSEVGKEIERIVNGMPPPEAGEVQYIIDDGQKVLAAGIFKFGKNASIVNSRISYLCNRVYEQAKKPLSCTYLINSGEEGVKLCYAARGASSAGDPT